MLRMAWPEPELVMKLQSPTAESIEPNFTSPWHVRRLAFDAGTPDMIAVTAIKTWIQSLMQYL